MQDGVCVWGDQLTHRVADSDFFLSLVLTVHSMTGPSNYPIPNYLGSLLSDQDELLTFIKLSVTALVVLPLSI